MKASTCVGRVGVLAVLLGVGLAAPPAIAAADDTASATTSSDGAPAGSDTADPPERTAPANDPSAPDNDSDIDSDSDDPDPVSDAGTSDGSAVDDPGQDIEPPEADTGDADEPAASGHDRPMRRHRAAVEKRVADEQVAAAESDAAGTRPAATDSAPAADEGSDPGAPSQPPAPVDIADAIAPPVAIVSYRAPDVTATRGLATPAVPFAPAPGGAPIIAPAMWLLAAASRRESAAQNTAPTASLAYQRSPSSFSGKVVGDVRASDADRDRLTYAASTPLAGSVTVNRSGTFTYTPSAAARHAAAAPGGITTDTFTITVSDGAGGTAVVPITVAIRPANAKPSATNTVAAPDPTSGVVQGSVVVKDRDGDPITYTAPATTARGTVTVDAQGRFTYTPTEQAREDARSVFRRLDSFTVTVDDGHGGTATTTVHVRIAPPPPNAAPANGSASVGNPGSDGVVTGTVSATDPNGDPLTYALGGTTPVRGTVVVTSDGSFTYTPTAAARHAAAATNAGAALRSDSFSVTVADGKGGLLTVPVTVTISPTNAAPVGGSATTGDADSTTGAVSGTLTASDNDGDPLTFSGSATTAKGEVVIATDGGFTYTPTVSARQEATESDVTDTFTVTVTDGYGGVATFDVTVAVSPLAASGEQPATGVITVPNPSGGPLEYQVSDDSELGEATVDADGTWTYTPTPAARHQAAADNADTTDKLHTFTVTVTDSEGTVTVVPITVSIVGANEVPVVTEEPEQEVDADTGVTSGVLIVTDADGDPIDADIDVDPAQGTVEYDITTGIWTFEATPEARHAAAAALAGGGTARMMRFAALAAADPTVATVTFTFRDGYGGVQTTVIDVQISPANEPPAITPVTGGAPAAVTGTVIGTVTVSDPDGDPPIFTVGTSAKGVEVTFDESTGQWTYTPTAAVRTAASAATASAADRLDSFTISVDDGHGGIANVVVTVPILFSTTADGHIAINGTAARPIVVSSDGRRAYLSTVEVAADGTTDYRLTVIDTAARTGYLVPLGSIDGPIALSADGARAYATSGDTVLLIDTATATSRAIALPGRTLGDVTFSANGDRVYVTTSDSSGDYALAVIDATTDAVRTVDLPDDMTDAVRVTPDGLRAFVMTASAEGVPAAAFTVIDLVTGESEAGLYVEDGELLTPVRYSDDSKYAYFVVRAPGQTADETYEFFIRLDTDTAEGGGGDLGAPFQGSIQLSGDGATGFLLVNQGRQNYIAINAADSTGGTRSFGRGNVVTSDLLVSDDGRFFLGTALEDGTEHYLTVVDDYGRSTYDILVPGSLSGLTLSADGTQVFGTVTSDDGQSFVVVTVATEEVQSVALPGSTVDALAISPDESQVYALTSQGGTHLLSLDAIPQPPVFGVPQISTVVGTTGRGYQFIYDENTDTTTILVANPDGHVDVAGTVDGGIVTGPFSRRVTAEIVTLADGGIAYVSVGESDLDDGFANLVVVTPDADLTSVAVPVYGQWIRSAEGTNYYLGLDSTDETAAVWRVTSAGQVSSHVRGYAANSYPIAGVTGPDGTLYVAVSQFGVDNTERASLWRISPSEGESIIALTPLDGTDITDRSYARSVVLGTDGTAYVLADTIGREPDGQLNQSAGVLVVTADGSVYRSFLPVPSGADSIATAGGSAVFTWFDRNNSWVSVIDAEGNRVDYPVTGWQGDPVSTADGSGAYVRINGDELMYVNAEGAVSTVDVGTYRGDIVAGRGATVYLLDGAGSRLIAVTDGVAEASVLETSFSTASFQYGDDGTVFAILSDGQEYRVAIPSAGFLSDVLYETDVSQFQVEVIGNTAHIVGLTPDGTQLLSIDSSGATVFDEFFSGDDYQPSGPVEIGPDGTFYYVFYEEIYGGPSDFQQLTRVFAANADGTREVFVTEGAPPMILDQFAANAVSVAPDGTLYVTVGTTDDNGQIVSTVHVVPAQSSV
ncbi:MAG: Ig-like domain-containing protein [Mycobacterium kyogaense]|uniref:Ig-like domain-containing protein n=1 Tax=Mycobacterium kyogaense TaxID=2212479 RepID=UPI002FFD54C4